MSEIVALLLDDAMPRERLGMLLHAARKRSGLKRRHAAAAAGTTAAMLRRYERGEAHVPADVCALLAECYGDDLTAHVPLRVPPQIDDGSLAIGAQARRVGSAPGDVIAGYVDIVHRLRSTEPGDPLALRSADIIALAGALGQDRDTIEQRIAEVLGCSPTEARRLHGELLRRKVILPVAGLAAGMAAFAGVAYAAQSPTPTGAQIETRSIVDTAPATVAATTPTTEARPVVSTPTTSAPTPSTTVTTPPAPATHVVPPSSPPTTAAPLTDATVPPADVPATVAPPQPDPNDPPVSVLPGETPITIIGTPDSTSQTP